MLCYGLFGFKFVLTCGGIILILNLIIIIAIKKKLPNPWVQLDPPGLGWIPIMGWVGLNFF